MCTTNPDLGLAIIFVGLFVSVAAVRITRIIVTKGQKE